MIKSSYSLQGEAWEEEGCKKEGRAIYRKEGKKRNIQKGKKRNVQEGKKIIKK